MSGPASKQEDAWSPSAQGDVLPDEQAVALLHDLVDIRSLSGDEGEAAHFLTTRMREMGFARAGVDAAGNAVGELGSEDAKRVVVLLGHIDTVPGEIAVRIEESDESDSSSWGRLYGRGSVDAKGPLATFTAAAARLGDAWARSHDLRLVVVGAVEEESATSRGARFIRARFDGASEPVPDACVIGEPSRWHRVTLGYKGRLLIDLEARRDSAHTAGPDPGVATVGVDLWNRVQERARAHNLGIDSPFAQLLPSLRAIDTSSDGCQDTVRMTCGVRLPLEFDARAFADDLVGWATDVNETEGQRVGDLMAAETHDAEGSQAEHSALEPGAEIWRFSGGKTDLLLTLRGHEAAWRGERSSVLARCFLRAIRETTDERPGFVSKTGTSDMNVVAPVWRCPILAYGPGDSALDHTPNEHIELEEYLGAIRVLQAALDHLATTLESLS